MNALGERLKATLDASKNLQAFLRVIREGETTQDEVAYRTMFGNKLFDDFAQHPRVAVRSKWGWTSAAGAYQFMAAVPKKVKTDTWGECQRALDLTDFSPESQDVAAVFLIDRRRALNDVVDGRFIDAIFKCRLEWASLPGSPYGQPVMTIERAMEVYKQYGGEIAQSVNQVSPTVTPVSTTMPANDFDRDPTDLSTAPIPAGAIQMANPAFLLALLPELLKLVPKLAKLFGSGSKVSDRNISAVEAVAEVAKNAVGARNEQELAEILKNDAAAAAEAKAAIEAKWFQIEEIGGGVQAAREANLVYARGEAKFWYNPAFWITAMLFSLPFIMVVDVFYIHPDTYDDNLRTQVVTGILTIVAIIGAYWLGTSHSSARKTDIMGDAINGQPGDVTVTTTTKE